MLSSLPDYVVKSLEPYTPSVAKDAAGYAVKTAESVYSTSETLAKSAYSTGENMAKMTYEKLTSYTPDPVLALLTSSMEGVAAVRADPVGSVKNYVPEFVIQGECLTRWGFNRSGSWGKDV
jgi:hypothetical protein